MNLHTFPFIIPQQHIMKRIFLFSFVLLSTLLRVEATAQDPDYLIYKGDTLRLYANPLEGYFEHLTRPDSLFPYTNTANARGYVAYWAIENDSLFLVDIKVEKWNNWLRCNRMVSLDKSLIFHNRKNTDRIFAEWVTDELLSPDGELLHYEHFGYEQEYSIERYFNIAKGILKSVREENNSKESFLSFMDIDSYISRYIEYNINYDNLSYIPNYPMQFMGFTYLDSMHSPKIEILPYDADSTILREIERVAENFHFLYDTFLKRHTRNLCFSIKIGPEARDAQMYLIMVPTLYSELEIQAAEDHHNDLPYYYYRLASGYMKLTQKLYNDTPVQHQYDTLLLQMYDGDSTVLWQYRYRHFPDSALKYKKLSYLQPSKHIYDQMGKFYEIQQLEHYLGIPHDTTIHPVFDTVFQKYFQYDCGSILPKGWEDNLNVNIEEEKQRKEAEQQQPKKRNNASPSTGARASKSSKKSRWPTKRFPTIRKPGGSCGYVPTTTSCWCGWILTERRPPSTGKWPHRFMTMAFVTNGSLTVSSEVERTPFRPKNGSGFPHWRSRPISTRRIAMRATTSRTGPSSA